VAKKTDWFDEWQIGPAGIGGDTVELYCPKANHDRPSKTPKCFVTLPTHIITIGRMRELAAEHRRKEH
jgi:hypothetical protein